MALTLLDLYNSTATQEWSMYDNDAITKDDFEKSLVLGINKAVSEILYSYPFSFRNRECKVLTVKEIGKYKIPSGLIKQNTNGDYCIRLNGKFLKYRKDFSNSEKGIPTSFYVQGEKLLLYPIPDKQYTINIEYETLAIGEDKNGEDIFVLKDQSDKVLVPTFLEELLKNAIITRTMLNSIASESDENYSAYKKQSETAYRLLIKYSKGVGKNKTINI